MTARANPLSRPAAADPVVRRTVATSSHTASTPSIAWGARIDHDDSPKIRTERPIGHSDRGVLSTVIALDASEDPKKNAFHDSDPAWAAAA